MTKLALYDPPMCCSTGVCGPAVDPVLPRVSADLDWLKRQGVQVERYNLAQQPQAFAANPTVTAALREHGNDCLPLVLVDGEVASRGTYPDRAGARSARGPRRRRRGVPETPKAAGSSCCLPGVGDHRRGRADLRVSAANSSSTRRCLMVIPGPAHREPLLHRQGRRGQDLGRQCHGRRASPTQASGCCS